MNSESKTQGIHRTSPSNSIKTTEKRVVQGTSPEKRCDFHDIIDYIEQGGVLDNKLADRLLSDPEFQAELKNSYEDVQKLLGFPETRDPLDLVNPLSIFASSQLSNIDFIFSTELDSQKS